MGSRARIIIADDDEHCCRTTAAFLNSVGYECDCVSTGEEALEFIKRNEYDLLLSDIEMPGNRDLNLIQSLPQVKPGLPVILMTGYPSVQTAADSVGLSVFAYFIKPVDPDILLDKVVQAIEFSRCYRKVVGTRERLLSTCEDLRRIETSFRVPHDDGSKSSITAFFDLTVQNVAASLLDMRQLFETMSKSSGESSDQEWLQSSRPLILINALRETIAVLAKTKSSFKSKELAELRRKLESLVKEPSQTDETPV
jgi:CheY-like chemotaxis protein